MILLKLCWLKTTSFACVNLQPCLHACFEPKCIVTIFTLASNITDQTRDLMSEVCFYFFMGVTGLMQNNASTTDLLQIFLVTSLISNRLANAVSETVCTGVLNYKQ